MSKAGSELQQKISFRKLILPVSIGVSVSVYLIITNFKPSALNSIHLTHKLVLGLFLGLVAISVRDFAFMYKIRLSTGEKFTWKKTFQTIIMWEFGAAITPKLGEVAFVPWVLKKSGLTYGRSIAALVLNTFLDNLAFVIVFTILYLILGPQMLAFNTNCSNIAGHKIIQTVRMLAPHVWIGYALFCTAAIFFGVALFLLPHRAKSFFYRLSAINLFIPFKSRLLHLGDEIEITAHEYQHRKLSFWFKMCFATLINWVARYLLANALLFAISTGNLNMLQVFAHQYVLWIFLVIPATPGASGVAELSFIAINCEFIPGDFRVAIAVATIWRIYSYYLYLVLGMLVMPKWAASRANN